MVSDFEFPTNAQIWHAQEPRGAQVVHVPRAADGYIPLENFAKAIDEQTQLVAITHVCFRNGAKLDIPGIVRLARAKGAKVLLDCYQSVGSLDIDVKALDVDFAAGGMLKYLLGTAGIGFLYVARLVHAVPGAAPTAAGSRRPRSGRWTSPPTARRQCAPLRGRHAAGGQLLCRRGGPEVAAWRSARRPSRSAITR